MHSSERNFLIVIYCCILVLILLVGFVVWYSNNVGDGRESTCRKIGSKLNLDYYGRGYCGWESECSYTCKFINQNGGVVIKNVQ